MFGIIFLFWHFKQYFTVACNLMIAQSQSGLFENQQKWHMTACKPGDWACSVNAHFCLILVEDSDLLG